METTAAFDGLVCTDCGERFDADTATHDCPECGGILDPHYDDRIDLTRDDLENRPLDGLWRYEELLPVLHASAVTMDEGTTPLVECPDLADELGVGRVLIKDEGRNPTGSLTDRGHALAVSAAREHGASDVALASTGDAGQSAAAYAARAGMGSHIFVPSRANFGNKAMINVHGGDMNVVEGRFGDAAAACADAMDDGDWYSIGSFSTPYRHEGAKTICYEIVEQLDWEVPDGIVHPTGSGVGLVGMHKGATEFAELGFTDGLPALYAAQSSGCAPIVEAWEEDKEIHEPWEVPDTISGGIEIPDPHGSPLVLDALRESEGGAVATSDESILDSAVTVAQHTGVEMGATGAAAASGAWDLAERGEFDADDTVVLVNTASANKEADILRSHLMGKGI